MYLFCSTAGIFLIVLHLLQLWQGFYPNRLFDNLLHFLYPFHLSNRYGIFAVMTTKRYEIVFEGSDDYHVWKEYTFFTSRASPSGALCEFHPISRVWIGRHRFAW